MSKLSLTLMLHEARHQHPEESDAELWTRVKYRRRHLRYAKVKNFVWRNAFAILFTLLFSALAFYLFR